MAFLEEAIILRDEKGRFIKGTHPKTGFKKGQIAWNEGKTSSEETRKKISEAKKGEKNPLYGKHHSEITKFKMSEAQKGIKNHMYGKHLSEEHKKKMSKTFKENISPERKKQMSEVERGEKNHAWKGGITSFAKLIRRSFQCRQWVSDVYTRDDFTCQECGQIGGKLNVHHYKSFSSILKKYKIITLEEALECVELFNINNGITLCKECHRKLHKLNRK